MSFPWLQNALCVKQGAFAFNESPSQLLAQMGYFCAFQ